MATSRKGNKSRQAANRANREVRRSAAQQTRRMGETTAEAGQNVAHAGADLLQKNAEMLQNALRFGPDLTTTVMGQSTDQLSRALGLSGNDVQRATERSTRSATTIIHSTSAVTKSVSGISQEYFAFVRHQIESGINRMNELWRCRTPQEVAAVQTEFLRESMENVLQSGRRMADMSLRAVDDAGRQITQATEQRRAA